MKPLVAVFAHPDDEVFGPGGTLAMFAKEREVYVICVTDGDAGKNSLAEPDSGVPEKKKKTLGEIRKEEMEESTQIIGVKKVFFLGYKDGTLCNNLYHEIAEKIEKIIKPITPEIVLTFEPRGVSGHIDHMAVSMITSFVFERSVFVKQLWYYCLTDKARGLQQKYFIYFPPGYKASEIDQVMDVAAVWEQKITAMHKHKSQKHDIDRILKTLEKRTKEEYFLILKK